MEMEKLYIVRKVVTELNQTQGWWVAQLEQQWRKIIICWSQELFVYTKFVFAVIWNPVQAEQA